MWNNDKYCVSHRWGFYKYKSCDEVMVPFLIE